MPAKNTVVCNVYQIIEFGAVTNLRNAEGGAINATVGADFHVIADFYRAHLGKFFIVITCQSEAEAVGADDGSRVDDGARAYDHAIVNGHVSVQDRGLADSNILAEYAAGANLAVVVNSGVLTDADMRPDGAVLSQLRAGSDDGRGMNASAWAFTRIEALERFGKRHTRVCHANEGRGQAPGESERHNDASGARRNGCLERFAIGGEGEITRFGAFNGVGARDDSLGFAFGGAGDAFCDLSNGERHNPSYLTLMAGSNEATYVATTARVDPGAVIGPGTRIGEYCVIESDVVIGAGCLLEPYVYVKRWTTLGNENEISAGTVLGTDPLDKAFDGKRSYLRIGHKNKIREHYTISRGTQPESETRIGDGNYIMTSGHIAHNAVLGDSIVVASCALVAGYVEIESQAFISGGVVIHQYSKIGRLAMVGGNTRVNSDLPPYFLYSDFNVAAHGLNIVGLKRAGFSLEEIKRLKAAYRLLYRAGVPREEALRRIEAELPSEHTRHLVEFVRASKRGICGAGS